MASQGTSRWRQAVKLAVVALLVGPLLVRWGFVGVDFAPSLDEVLPSLRPALLVRLVGLGIVLAILLFLVYQKRRSRGQRGSRDAAEQAGDRDIEGSGEVYAPYAYNNQQGARREGERIRERAEEIAETDRDAYDRR